MTAPPHEVIVLQPGDSLVQECYNVRINVFHHEQGFPLETEIDDLDETATHILLRITAEQPPISAGTIRVTYSSAKGCYKLSRLAVLKEYRQYRFGKLLVQALEDWVKSDAAERLKGADHTSIISHSQIPVMGFYAKYGYRPEGDLFDEDGAPHQLMKKDIPLRNE